MRNESRKSGSGRGGEKPVAEKRYRACRLLLRITVFREDIGQAATVTAANDLGLTDAVPDRITVLTDGRLRPIRLGNLTIDFQYKAPRRVLPPPKTRTYHKGKEVSDNR